MHSTANLEDGYMGSGKRLRYSIRKYGKEKHIKEILEFFDSRELLIEAEKRAITSNMLIDKMCMNLKEGGNGGGKIWSPEHQKILNQTGNKAFLDKLRNNPEFRENYSKKISEAKKKEYQNGTRKNDWSFNWTGKKHSDETKAKMREVKTETGLGEKNSQYGTCWITKDGENRKIKKEELELFLLNGWVKGRYTKLSGEDVSNSKLTKLNVLEIKIMLDEGIKQKIIAKKFNVSQESISKINRGLIWK
jgi:hypothetical protein